MLSITDLLQQAREHLALGDVGREYVGFLAHFFSFGALGFCFAVVRQMRLEDTGIGSDSAYSRASRTAALIGLIGAAGMAYLMIAGALGRPDAAGLGFVDALAAAGPQFLWPLAFVLLMAAGFLGAVGGLETAWMLAGVAGIAYAFRTITTGRWFTLINPLHEVFASLWIGTLFVLVAAGLPAILRQSTPPERRGPLVAEMVANFSNLALVAATCLGITGVITAWHHLKYLAALWTTPYGVTCLVKLSMVALVVIVGAWNWRRMRPRLGGDGAVKSLRRSATAELIIAAVVLAITAVLVSLPSPKLPG
jgi:copper transport protein